MKINIGDKFSFLTVQEKLPKYRFLVQCVCGNTKSVAGGNLNKALRPIRSCGCKSKSLLSAARTVHGHAARSNRGHTRTYQSWMSMKERCDIPDHKSYKDYGGRGVAYSPRWNDFLMFLADMGVRPKGKTLGRIRNELNYGPDNCEWQTHKEQARNRRSTRYIEFDGKRLCLAEWAERTGYSDDVLTKRLDAGWTVERALTTPVRKMARYSMAKEQAAA